MTDRHWQNSYLKNIGSKIDAQRYRDNNELLYSLRSVEKYAPFFRKIFIVTDNQIPSWLDTSNPKIEVVFHSQIFEKKFHLPVFNSHAIEMNLHNIPGLSNFYVYSNDDLLFAKEIQPTDLINDKYQFFAHSVSTTCDYSCTQRPNDICLPECDLEKVDKYRHSGINGNRLLNTVYPRRERRGTAHTPYVINKEIMLTV